MAGHKDEMQALMQVRCCHLTSPIYEVLIALRLDHESNEEQLDNHLDESIRMRVHTGKDPSVRIKVGPIPTSDDSISLAADSNKSENKPMEHFVEFLFPGDMER